ncbi:MAG: hypothetical protein HY247_06955 [archaeon]|nr:MAG: hypothetical protein HY247_06955 [archaeon]
MMMENLTNPHVHPGIHLVPGPTYDSGWPTLIMIIAIVTIAFLGVMGLNAFLESRRSK